MTIIPVARKANIVIRELEAEVLLYDLSVHKALCLNQTSALVYQFCDGTNSVAEISALMSKDLKTLISEDVVWLSLKELRKHNLLENGEAFSAHAAGLSRRELLKRVRVASMVALPLIVTVVAPSAAMAATCIPFFEKCNPQENACCPGSICVTPGICGCRCVNPGQCLTQTACPSTVNCNASGMCAP